MGKYADNNSIEELEDAFLAIDDEDDAAYDDRGIEPNGANENDEPTRLDYAMDIDDEDLEWDLPDAGDDHDLDSEEAAAWEAGTLALLGNSQNWTDHHDDGAADEYRDRSGYPDDEMPEPADEIYTEELPHLDSPSDTDVIEIIDEGIDAYDAQPDTDVLPAIPDGIPDDTAALNIVGIQIIDDGIASDPANTDTDVIEIIDEGVSTDTDVIEIIDEGVATDPDGIEIIDEGIPADTDMIPMIDAADLANVDALEAAGAAQEHALDGDDAAAGEPVRRHHMALDYAIWVAGAAAVILAVIAGLQFQKVMDVRAEAAQYQTLGSAIAGVGIIGEDQITAIRKARVQKDADRKVAEQEAAEKAELAANEGTVPVTMALSSVERDLKIKIHGESGSLIAGVPFKVSVTLPSGKTAEYSDDDQDGIIYQSGLTAGTYKVLLEQLVADTEDGTDVTETDDYKNYSQYRIPTDAQSVEVKDKIAYAAIDVSDEIKTTAQVNVAAEDTQQKIATESEVQDTVEYVESTATTTAEEDALYEVVDKSEIVEPNVSARADLVIGNFRMLAENSENNADESAAGNDTEAATVSEENNDSNSDNSGSGNSEDNNDNSGNGNSEDNNNDNSGNGNSENDDNDNSGNDDSEKGTSNGENDGEESKRAYTTTIKGSTSVAVGGTTLITASTDEPGATTYTWELDGDAISIDRTEGKTVTVTGNQEGTATLKVTAHLVAEDADPTENVVSTEITVTAAEESSDKRISVSPSSVTLAPGKTQSLSVSLEGVDDDSVTYESAESMIAEVSGNGTITAHTVGETTITVTANADSSLKQSVKVKVVETETNEDGNTLLQDKNGNQIYVKDNGAYREATAADYDTFDTFYRKIEGKAVSSGFKYTGWQNIGGKTYYFNSAGEPVTGNQVINGASYTFGADGALTSGTSKVGIDVSQWNGSISWSQVASSGISYAIIRCGYRGSSTGALIKDPNFATNMAGATAAGLKAGIYVFSQAVNEVEAVEEASMAISMASGYGVSMPIFIDVEAAGGRADSLSTSQRTAVVSAFCQTVQASGYSAGVYSNTNWLSECINTPALTSYHIWVAQYSSSLSYARTRYDIWQYSSKGRVSGISGDVDMNMSYRSY